MALSGPPDPSLPPELADAQARARAVPVWIRLPLIVVALALPVYWIATDSGPYRAVAELQARLFGGSHYVVLSGALALLVALVPAVIAVQLLALAFRPKR